MHDRLTVLRVRVGAWEAHNLLPPGSTPGPAIHHAGVRPPVQVGRRGNHAPPQGTPRGERPGPTFEAVSVLGVEQPRRRALLTIFRRDDDYAAIPSLTARWVFALTTIFILIGLLGFAACWVVD